MDFARDELWRACVAARRDLDGVVVNTPLVPARSMADCARVYLKAENHQHTGAFKFRGAFNYCHDLAPEALAAGLVTASSGNHALGLSLAGRQVNSPVTVVMPETSPAVKAAGCTALGARVVRWGPAYDDAAEHARHLAEEMGATYVPSFDSPLIAAGQSTIAWEILTALPNVQVIVAPVGGGGLLAGILGLIKLLPQPLAARFFPARRGSLSDVKVIGVQARGAASMVESVAAGERICLSAANTVADGISVRQPGEWTWQVVAALADGMVTVEDSELLAALGHLAVHEKTVAEPAGAAAFAAVMQAAADPAIAHPLLRGALARGDDVACIVSGGNVQPELLAKCAGMVSGY